MNIGSSLSRAVPIETKTQVLTGFTFNIHLDFHARTSYASTLIEDLKYEDYEKKVTLTVDMNQAIYSSVFSFMKCYPELCAVIM
jgi:hypothetical protein